MWLAGSAQASLAGSAQASAARSYAAPGRVAFSVDGGAASAVGGGAGAGAGRAVALPNGGAVVVGRAGGSLHGFYAAQLNATGALDPSFGTRGVARVAVDSPPAVPLQVLRQPDGKLIVIVSGRQTTAFAFGQLVVVRLDANGSLDPSFGSGGVAMAPVAPTCGACTTAALAPDGDIFVTGQGGLLSAALGGDPSAATQWIVAGLTASGGLDGNFGAGGLETISSSDADGYDIAVLPSGEVVTLGVTNVSSTTGSIPILTLLGPNGGADRSFNAGNPVSLPAGSGATAMLARADGSVTVGARDSVFRYTSSGQPDPSFGVGGVASFGGLPRPLSLLPAAGGDVLAIGRASGTSNTLTGLRIKPDGSADATLGGTTGVRVRPRFGGGTAGLPASAHQTGVPQLVQDAFAVHAVAARPDGSYLAVGGVGVLAPTGRGRGRSTTDFAVAGLTPELAPLATFGGRASRVRVKLSIPSQSAASAGRNRAIRVILDVSGPGLARVEVRASGRVIAQTVTAIFGTRPSIVSVALTPAGAGLLGAGSAVRVTATATARDLVAQGASASTAGTLG